MKHMRAGRRSLMTGLIAAISGVLVFRWADGNSTGTPHASEGPFYPRPSMRPSDTDHDLVKIVGRVEEAGGEIIVLRGTLKNRQGEPLPGYRIEIWQCDVNGKYLHPGDDRDIVHDTGFQGFGHAITDARGAYTFRTIKPTAYPGRTPHIHVKVLEGETETLTTQFYIKDHPQNRADSLFRSMSETEAERVSMTFAQKAGGLETEVHIVI